MLMDTDDLNLVTTLALLGWPVVAIWLYKTRPIGRATLWTILGAYMLLPVGPHIKFPIIPDFNKSSIPNLAALCVLPEAGDAGRWVLRWLPRAGAIRHGRL